MKKTCFVLLCALLLGLAPTTFAADSTLGPLEELLGRLIAMWNHNSTEAEPAAQPSTGSEEAPPPNNNPATNSEPERGWEIPPGG